jgi:sugar phosphate isomerase/epimerase
MTKKRIHHRVAYASLNEEWYNFFTENGIFPEIYFTAEQVDTLDKSQILALEKDLHTRNLSLSIHAPFLDLAPGAFDEKIREVTRNRLEKTLDIAEFLKPNIIDCHAHYERNRYGGQIERWVDNAARTFDPLVKRAEKLDIILAVENTFEDDPTPIDKLIDKINSPNLRACFDNGHFHMFHKTPLKRWWEVLGEKTALLHLHDNHGEKDEHLPIGDGNFPFPAYFNLLKDFKKERTYTLECNSILDGKKTLQALRRLMEHFLD